ncbi:MAG TPA: MBL fold metallo-hydrolase, partial [Chitinophagaceae bacterium]|nr:MBL fold metallo-hydrolase [Chitinophagaceae bacterium]
MFIKQLYTDCLSESAYYIESEGAAAVIDPLRDVELYLELAGSRGASIQYIFETHFHADFVSGHLDLAAASKAPIVYGPDTVASFPFLLAIDGQEFPLGKIRIRVLHTPGHTLESTCYLVIDEAGKPAAIFTGDTLFVGDVGRPDLSQQDGQHSTAEMAGMLYDSLKSKILPLPDDIIIYPAHGAGSNCGKNLGNETYSSLGEQRESNYALKAESRDAFIKAVTEGLPEPPQYFPINAQINKEGYESLQHILDKGLRPLSPAEVELMNLADAILLDTRPPEVFTNGFVPGSINIGLDGRFAEWAGSLLPFDQPIVLITEKGREKETITRLARVGFQMLEGYLDGAVEAWKASGREIDLIVDIEADELAMDLPYDKNIVVLDVRREVEYADGHLKAAVNLPLNEMTDPEAYSHF